jgi:hypothetical protein
MQVVKAVGTGVGAVAEKVLEEFSDEFSVSVRIDYSCIRLKVE